MACPSFASSDPRRDRHNFLAPIFGMFRRYFPKWTDSYLSTELKWSWTFYLFIFYPLARALVLPFGQQRRDLRDRKSRAFCWQTALEVDQLRKAYHENLYLCQASKLENQQPKHGRHFFSSVTHTFPKLKKYLCSSRISMQFFPFFTCCNWFILELDKGEMNECVVPYVSAFSALNFQYCILKLNACDLPWNINRMAWIAPSLVT